MDLSVKILECRTSPILCLCVSPPAAIARVADIPGQTAVKEFHITLSRLDDLGLSLDGCVELPAPPERVWLSRDIKIVDTGLKRSCYVELDSASQDLLRAYLRRCEAVLGIHLLDEARIFHVTLGNAGGGGVRESVGAVWEHKSQLAFHSSSK